MTPTPESIFPWSGDSNRRGRATRRKRSVKVRGGRRDPAATVEPLRAYQPLRDRRCLAGPPTLAQVQTQRGGVEGEGAVRPEPQLPADGSGCHGGVTSLTDWQTRYRSL